MESEGKVTVMTSPRGSKIKRKAGRLSPVWLSVKQRLRRSIKPALILLVAVALLVIIYVLVPARPRITPERVVEPVAVEVYPVSYQVLPDVFELPAVIEPNRIVMISTEVAGRVERIHKEQGQHVEAGELLIELDEVLLRADLDRIEAQLAYELQELERIRDLIRRDAAADQELRIAQTQVDILRAQRSAARSLLDKSQIFAPSSGRLNDVFVEEGEYVQSAVAIARIVDVDTVLAVVDVPERDIHFLSDGQQAVIRSNQLQEQRTGTITYISKLADTRTRTSRIEISIQNTPNGQETILRSGQMVRVVLTRREIPQTVLIPLTAVSQLEDGYEVFVVEDGLAQSRRVELGIFRGNQVQILSGLEENDQVIVRGWQQVGPGQPVIVGDPYSLSNQP